MPPATDIILPVHNALEYTKHCVETILAHTPALNRIILVDDVSDGETRDYLLWLLDHNKSWLYMRTGSQRWWTRAVNLGLRQARTERTVVINSDCEVNDGWMEELYDVWDEAAGQGLRVGLVGSQMAMGEARRWVSTKEPNYVTGHCLLFNIHVLQQASDDRGCSGWYLPERPGVDDRCAHIFSDNEICYQLNRMGYATITSFKAPVGHHGGRSWGHDLSKVYGLRGSSILTGEIIPQK
jgi:GT2 family glycosyltransferase